MTDTAWSRHNRRAVASSSATGSQRNRPARARRYPGTGARAASARSQLCANARRAAATWSSSDHSAAAAAQTGSGLDTPQARLYAAYPAIVLRSPAAKPLRRPGAADRLDRLCRTRNRSAATAPAAASARKPGGGAPVNRST